MPVYSIIRLVIIICLGFATGCVTPSIQATRSIQLGDLHNNRHDYREATVHYENYLEGSAGLGVYRNTETEADVRRKVAHAYSALNQFEKSLIHLKKALELDSALNNNVLGMIEDYRLMGLQEAYQGRYKAGLIYLDKAVTLNEGMDKSFKTVKKASILDTYVAIARVRMVLGDFDIAGEMLNRGKKLLFSVPDKDMQLIEISLIRGIISRETGDLDKAYDFLKRSADLARQKGLFPTRQLQARAQIGLLKGDFEQALRDQLEAYRFAEKSGIIPQIILTLLRLGEVYQTMGDVEQAETIYLKAMEIQSDTQPFSVNGISEAQSAEVLSQTLDLYESQGAKVGAAMAALKLGNIMMDQEEYGRVVELLQKAFDYFDQVQSDEGLARAHLLEGRLSLKMERHDLSLESLNKAISLTSQPDLEWKLWYQKGRAFEQKQVLDSARSAYHKSIAIIEQLRGNMNVEELKSAFVSNKVVVYGKYIDLLFRSYEDSGEPGLLEEAFEVNERARARAFLDMIGNNKVGALESGDTEAIELEQLLRAKIQQLNKKIRTTKQRALIKDLSEELHRTQQQYQQLLLEIKLDHPGYSELIAIDPPPLSEIRQKLDTGSLIIEYWSGEEGTIAWLVSNASVKAFRLNAPKITVKRLMALFRNSVELQDRSFIQKSLRNLYDILILPFEEDLVNYDRLIFVPHGGMHFLPFQALVDKNGHYLVEKHIISSAPSASVWLHCLDQGEIAQKNTLLGMALGHHPVGNYPGLPATTKEIGQLAKIYDSFESKSGTGFTESYFKSSVRDFDYLHVATHGVLNRQQPGYSYLLMHPSDLDDGKLTVNEIFNIKLNARLVALSACETGLGAITEGDDLVGLSRAFIYGGAPAVVVSLWKVDDASTAVLMTRFHQYLASGKDVASALSYAQRDFIRRTIWSSDKGLKPIEWDRELQSQVKQNGDEISLNPYYWAPFVLIGH